MNIKIKGELSGVIDIYRCRRCGMMHVDERYVGDPIIPDTIGIKDLESPSRWGVLVCRGKEIEWNVYLAGGTYVHETRLLYRAPEQRRTSCREGFQRLDGFRTEQEI
ncbi:MAG: hypothetical protein ACP5GS_05935 [Nitrososphaeria archaeon]